MKKVGLITFHSSINYGVYLQAYALQSVINNLGFSAEIIDYNRMSEEIEYNRNKSVIYRIINFNDSIRALKLKAFRSTELSREREKKFADFSKKYFYLSKPINSYSELVILKNEYDYYVCGSDQIWNPIYTKGNPAYFLAFADKTKRVMYAPSYGIINLDMLKPYWKIYKKNILELHGLSVRETSGIKITEEISGLTPKLVVDPTLLLTSDEWIEIERKPSSIPKKYILFYVLGNDYKYELLAKEIHKKSNLSIVTIPNSPIWDKKSTQYIQEYAGVDEFIYLIRNAEYVFTDSFHGVAFSTKFNKNFSAIKREDTKYSLFSRIEDYLQKIGLYDRCVTVGQCFNTPDEILNNKVDYSKSNIELQNWIKESRDYLKDSLI